MARKKSTIPKFITEKYGEKPRIWSYSNISSVSEDSCTWSYYLSRIRKFPSEEGIYGFLGSCGHSQLESFYNGKISYDDMLKKFEEEYLIIETGQYKFTNDEDKNQKRSKKYKDNLIHFFKNHKPIPSKVLTETECWTVVQDNVFVLVIDAIHKDSDDNYVITDWKTSSYGAEYKGENLKHKSYQLLLYAYALHKLKNIPLEKIKCRWCFLKYCIVDIDYMIKSKKEIQHKQYIAERCEWVDKIKSQLKKDIIRYYPDITDIEQDIMLEQCIANNNLDILCDNIKKNYILNDFYLYTDVNDESIQALESYIVEQINLINKLGDNPDNWRREKPISYVDEYGKDKDDSFYCNTICGQKKNCVYFKQYLDDQKTASQRITDKEDEDLLAELELLM